jgi:hypothetical protein
LLWKTEKRPAFARPAMRTAVVLLAAGFLIALGLVAAAPPAAAIDCVQVNVGGHPTDPCATVLDPVCAALGDAKLVCESLQ